MSDYFPPEILDEILKRLPSKSLCRFRSVSKSWYARITSQSFISFNLNYNLNFERNTHLLLRVVNYGVSYAEKIEKFSFYPYDDTVCSTPESLADPCLTLNTPSESGHRFHPIVGYCNGLVCFAYAFRENIDIDLWNPSIRKYIELPSAETVQRRKDRCRVGFGADSLNRDVKVVRIVYQFENMDPPNYVLPPSVEIYSVSTGAWRRIEASGLKQYLHPSFTDQAYVNSRVHWANDCRNGEFQNMIISFDMNDEVFREILLPKELAHNNTTNWLVTVCMECLGVVGVDQTGQCFVWVMKEYGNTESWTKLYMVDVKLLSELVGFRKNGDILMLTSHDQSTKQLALFDPNNEAVVELGIFGSGYAMYADKYVESLVLIDTPNLDE